MFKSTKIRRIADSLFECFTTREGAPTLPRNVASYRYIHTTVRFAFNEVQDGEGVLNLAYGIIDRALEQPPFEATK